MDIQQIIGLFSRWLHIIPATLLVGGTLFMRLSLVPAAQETDASAELRESIRKRWSKLIMGSVLFLLISGFYNAIVKVKAFELSGVYVGLLLTKIILAFAIFYLTAVLAGRSARAQKFRESETKWLNILCALMLALVMIAGYMKMSSASFEKKTKPPTENSTSLLMQKNMTKV